LRERLGFVKWRHFEQAIANVNVCPAEDSGLVKELQIWWQDVRIAIEACFYL